MADEPTSNPSPTGEQDAAEAHRRELAAQDVPPRRRQALWPERALVSEPGDVPGTDPDGVEHE